MQPGSRARRSGAAADPTPRLLLASGALALVALLGRLLTEPFDHGYIRYAGAAAQMLSSGDWVVPRIGSEPYLHKPPLYLWLIAAPMAVTGPTAGWVQQVPNLLAVALLLAGTAGIGRRLFGARAPASAAAGILVTSALCFSLIRGKRIDPLYSAWLCASFGLLHVALLGESGRIRGLATLASGVCLGLALLVKGPLALVFHGLLTAGCARFIPGARGRGLRVGGVGALVACGVALPWLVLVLVRLGPGPALAAFEAPGALSRHAGPLHYLVKLPVQMLPWSLLLPFAAVALWRRRRSLPASVRFLLCWVAAVLLPLQLSPVKHSRYALPAFPAFALLIAATCYDRGPVAWAPLTRPGARRVLAVLLAAALAGGAVLDTVAGLRFPPAAERARALASLAPVARGAPARAFATEEIQQVAVLLATGRFLPSLSGEPALRIWLASLRGRGPAFLLTSDEGAGRVAALHGTLVRRRAPIALTRHPPVLIELDPGGAAASSRKAHAPGPSATEPPLRPRRAPERKRLRPHPAAAGRPRSPRLATPALRARSVCRRRAFDADAAAARGGGHRPPAVRSAVVYPAQPSFWIRAGTGWWKTKRTRSGSGSSRPTWAGPWAPRPSLPTRSTCP